MQSFPIGTVSAIINARKLVKNVGEAVVFFMDYYKKKYEIRSIKCRYV